jgi:hypothetical protein
MPRLLQILAALCVTTACTLAWADEGKVMWSDPSCSYFIVAMDEEFGMFEWRSGAAPEDGDNLVGALKVEGMHRVDNATKGVSNEVILLAVGPRIKSLINSSPSLCKRRYRAS